MAYQDDRQLNSILLVLCIQFLVPATSVQDIPECGEVKIAIKTNEGYKCVCNREENHFTISDGRTCGFRSGGCQLGEELQDDGECRACPQGTFKNISGAALCKKQTDIEMQDLETVSYGDSSKDVTYSSTRETTLLKDISRATEQSTIGPAASATGGSDTHNDDGSRGVIIIALSIAVVVLVGIVIVCACVRLKEPIWTRMWKNMRRNNSLNAPNDGDYESTRTGVMDGGLMTPEEEPLTGVVVFEASPQSVSSQSSQSECIDGQKDCLLKNQHYFVQHMDNVKKVCDYLLSSCVLMPNLVAEIMAEKTHADRVRELHTLISKESTRAFDKYYEALEVSGNKELSQQLKPFLTPNLPTGQGAMER